MTGKEAIEIIRKEIKVAEIKPVMDHPLNRKYRQGVIAGLKRAIDELERHVFVRDLIDGKITLAKYDISEEIALINDTCLEADHTIDVDKFEGLDFRCLCIPIEESMNELGIVGGTGYKLYIHPDNKSTMKRGVYKYMYNYHPKRNLEKSEIETILGMQVEVHPDIQKNTMLVVAKEWYEHKDTRFIQKIVIK